jgi:hypothetical protein
MQEIKSASSHWINDNQLTHCHFTWQEGYGAFSYSKSHLPAVIRYIKNQEQHHSKKTFIEEYIQILQKQNIEYNERFIFKPID